LPVSRRTKNLDDPEAKSDLGDLAQHPIAHIIHAIASFVWPLTHQPISDYRWPARKVP
jgi:hypothetical protein